MKAGQMTKEELERLVRAYEEELDYYRSLFSVDQFTARLQDHFGLTKQLASALKLFLDTGRVSNEALTKIAEVFGRKDEHEKDYSKIMIWRLRKALEDFGINIENSYGWGYHITPETLKEIKDVVNTKKGKKKK
jgi:DNA-binding response OmpR family regulator